MVPVAIALVGKGFRRSTVAFMGWFGPRGLASVVFTLIALEELHGTPLDEPLMGIATWTILLGDPAGSPRSRWRARTVVGSARATRRRRSSSRWPSSRPAAPPAPDGGATHSLAGRVLADRRSIRSCGVLVVRW